MKINTTKRQLEDGQQTVGAWVTLASSLSAEFMAQTGFDWLVVDGEHSPANLETMLHCFQAISTTSTIPMARVAWNDQTMIKQLLDTGALGLIVPMIMDREQAELAASYAKYPPEGVRGIARARCTVYGDDYPERANDEIVIMVQIEHIDAVDRCEEILGAKGITGVFIGPTDLAWSMGLPMGAPEHEAAIQKVLTAGKSMGVPVGIMTATGAQAKQRVSEGFNFVSVANDAVYLKTFAKQVLEEARSGLPQ